MELHLSSYGNKINIQNGMFCIASDGETQKIPVKDVSAIHINRSAGITADALFTAVENGIDVILTARGGKTMGRIWSAQYGSISTIRKHQLSFSQTDDSVGWILSNLYLKAQNQITLLLWFDGPQALPTLRRSQKKMGQLAERYKALPHLRTKENLAQLRGIEGNISKLYFAEISTHLPLDYRFEGRSQHPAKDMFNALLNYAYGMLYGKIEGLLIKAGIDPYVGVFHRDDYNKPVLVYDVIERYRIWADAVVINLCMQHVIFSDFFEVEIDQAHFLNDFGKKILITAFVDFMDEVIVLDGESAARITHIKNYCTQLATHFRNQTTLKLCSI
jgi:CRISPR-associated protein Cas1